MTIAERSAITEKIKLLPVPQQAVVIALGIKLASLNIESYYHGYIEGPIVETFYFKLGNSVPLAKILGKAEDMAFATNRESAVIIREGGTIGIQLARKERKRVSFSDCLFRLAPQLLEAKIPILLGQSYKGEYVFLDLADEPHALIAGSTNSGKSMFLLSTICTLAVCKLPEELHLIIVDSKQVDLALCEGLSHVRQVCRNALELHDAVDKLLNEMRRRNSLMAGIARNIDEYNQQLKTHNPNPGTNSSSFLPRIVLIIDEFADIIEEDHSQAKAKIEPFASLARIGERLRSLAQLCRASGIHIIAATQRPSVKITSGDLKVNLPCRISFKLPSIHDSKTVLKEIGAESLLGQGDMLVQTIGKSMFRAHAPYVDLSDLGGILMNVQGVRHTLEQVAAAHTRAAAALLGEGVAAAHGT